MPEDTQNLSHTGVGIAGNPLQTKLDYEIIRGHIQQTEHLSAPIAREPSYTRAISRDTGKLHAI